EAHMFLEALKGIAETKKTMKGFVKRNRKLYVTSGALEEFKLIQAVVRSEQEIRQLPERVANMTLPQLLDHYKNLHDLPGDALPLCHRAIAFLTAARKELLPLAGPAPPALNVLGRENQFQYYDIAKAGSVFFRLSILKSFQCLLIRSIVRGHMTSKDKSAFDLEEVKRKSNEMVENSTNDKAGDGDDDGEIYDFDKGLTLEAARNYALSARFYPEDSLQRVYALYRYMFSAMRIGAITVGKLLEMYEKMRTSVKLVVEYYPLSNNHVAGEKEIFAKMQGDVKRIVHYAYRTWKKMLDIVAKGLEKRRKVMREAMREEQEKAREEEEEEEEKEEEEEDEDEVDSEEEDEDEDDDEDEEYWENYLFEIDEDDETLTPDVIFEYVIPPLKFLRWNTDEGLESAMKKLKLDANKNENDLLPLVEVTSEYQKMREKMAEKTEVIDIVIGES
ncbi:hypothetical protein HK102_001234, partial [Quaeritorhiza haematococci]